MGYTKRDVVNGAYQELGLDPDQFDLPPSLLETGRKRLDAMMGEWGRKGIRVGYPIPGSPGDGALDDETNLPDSAWEAVIANLAVRLAPGRGKTISPATAVIAKGAYNTLLALAAVPEEIQLQRIPAGAGNKPWRWGDPFLPGPQDRLTAGPDGPLEFI